MKQEIITCDECRVQKKDVNHWFVALFNADGIRIMTAESSPHVHTSEVGEYLDLCGQACVIRAVQKWMAPAARPFTTEEKLTFVGLHTPTGLNHEDNDE